jgi:hypothetical protein
MYTNITGTNTTRFIQQGITLKAERNMNLQQQTQDAKHTLHPL